MVILIANFTGLVLFCTLVMVMDFLVKRAKYSRWKVRLHMLCEDDFQNQLRCSGQSRVWLQHARPQGGAGGGLPLPLHHLRVHSSYL